DRKLVELAPHRIDRRLVGRHFVPPPPQPRRRDCGALGDSSDLERQDAGQLLMRLYLDRCLRSSPRPRLGCNAFVPGPGGPSAAILRLSRLFDTDQLRLALDDPFGFDLRELPEHRILRRRIESEDDPTLPVRARILTA